MKKFTIEIKMTSCAAIDVTAKDLAEARKLAEVEKDNVEYATFVESYREVGELVGEGEEMVTGYLLSWWHPELGIYLPYELAVNIESNLWEGYGRNPLADEWFSKEFDFGLIDRFGQGVFANAGDDWDFRLGVECPPFGEIEDIYEGEAVTNDCNRSPFSPHGSNRYQVRKVSFDPVEDLSFFVRQWLNDHPSVRFEIKSI